MVVLFVFVCLCLSSCHCLLLSPIVRLLLFLPLLFVAVLPVVSFLSLCFQILGVKSRFFHRVLQPSDELFSSAWPTSRLPVCVPLPRLFPKSVLNIGHILRHANQYEHTVCFSSAHAYRQIASPYRRGAPSAHWPEVAMTEAYHRALLRNAGSFPSPYDVAHDAYQCGTLSMVKHYNAHSMPACFDNTRMWRLLHPLA